MACDDSWGGWSRLELSLRVPIPTELPSPLSETDETLPSGYGKFIFCHGDGCWDTGHVSFGKDGRTSYEGTIEAYDLAAGEFEMDFAVLVEDGFGGTIRIEIEGQFDWDSDEVMPELPNVTGKWLVEPLRDAGASAPFGVDLEHEGARITGLVCDTEFNCRDFGLNGYVSDAVAYITWVDEDGENQLEIREVGDAGELQGKIVPPTGVLDTWGGALRPVPSE